MLLLSLAHATCMALYEPNQTTYQAVDADCQPITSVRRGETVLAIIVPPANGACSPPGGPLYLHYEAGPDLTVYTAEGEALAVEVKPRTDVICPVEGVPNPFVVSLDTSSLAPGAYRVDQAAFTVLPPATR